MGRETLKLLVVGQLDSIHVAHMARAMAERNFDVVVAGTVVGGFGEPLRSEPSLQVIELPRVSSRTVRGVASQILTIRRLVREHRPDVVQAHWLCGDAAFAALAGASPLASMAWGSDVLRASPVQRLANRIAVRRSALAFADSIQLCEAMIDLGARREKVALIAHGVDLDLFSPPVDRVALRARLGLPTGRLVFSPRTLAPLYNPLVIVEAFAMIADRVPDANLLLHSYHDSSLDLGPLPVPDRIHLVGRVPYEQVPEYLGAADACVSIPSSDGSPRTVWEAMACGSPVILSDLPWLQGLIEPGLEALVVPIDARAVADALLTLLTNPIASLEIATNALALTQRQMSRDSQMDKLASRLRAIVDTDRGSPGRERRDAGTSSSSLRR